MGLFDKIYKSNAATYTPSNEQEAWIAIMHACIAVDEEVTDEELEELSETLAHQPLFEGHQIREYYRTVLLAHAEFGSKQLIDQSVDKVPPANRAALFAASIELLLADGLVTDQEKELFRYLTSALDLEEKIARKIIHNLTDPDKDLGEV
jgi:uncharacterized tellurite resistance protein B-like protein